MHLGQDSVLRPVLPIELAGLSLSKSGVRVSKLISVVCSSVAETCRAARAALEKGLGAGGGSCTGKPASGRRGGHGCVRMWSGTRPRRRLWVVRD